jgi:hypothetical protein
MLKTKSLFVIVLFASGLLISCGGKKKSSNTNGEAPIGAENIEQSKITSSPNISQASLSIDGKEFTISADSINTTYYPSDSALVLSIKGIAGGALDIYIPNLFKCPCKILPAYGSARTDADAGTKNKLWPTVKLLNYPVKGFQFNNLNDGYNKKEAADNTIEILAVEKLNVENRDKYYLIEGKIQSTVFKSGYESPDDPANKDYSIKGNFKIQAIIPY